MINACTSLPKGQAEMDVGVKERGMASWYGEDFHGLVTANGETYDMEALTGAHRTLPLGTVVRVTNVVNGEHARVRINDRGPYVNGRILDLSFAAARQLDMVDHGISAVQLEVIGYQEEEWLLTDERGGMTSWTLAPLEDGPLPGHYETGRASSWRLIQISAPGAREVRLPPGDILRERRFRRVADILAAEHRVYAVAALQIP
jgi:rare lipoprotein A